MDRHSDRVDHNKAQQPKPPDPGRDRNIREQVHQRTTSMRRSAAKGASSGRAIDAELDQIVSQQAMHTTERTGDRADARVRDDIESYRREMQLAAIAGSRQRQSKETLERAGKTDLSPTRPSAHARAAGQSRPPRATARNQTGARPGGPARQHATLRLTAPNFGNMRIGGNRNAIAPVRQQVPLTRSELDRIRGRYKEARTNTPMR